MDVVDEFGKQRPRLFGLAYRMLGSAAEAEDVVQETFVRWSGADHDAVRVPSAWLAKVATNLCLNRLASARMRRERYVGPWLPEPVLTTDGSLGPLETAEQRDSVSLGLLVLLERLTPAERAVFVLREAFAYGYREIAEILELSEAHCRQLHRRAHQRVQDGRSRFRPDEGQRRRLVDRFLAAARDGDVRDLEQLLAADVISWADGGGMARAARRPVLGVARVARYLVGGWGKFTQGIEVTVAELNGEPSVLGLIDGKLAGVLVPEFADERISALRIVANPDKLAYLAGQLGTLSHPWSVAGSS